ncbi:MAG: ferredoxin [Deltaproteobacteria bacterium]|nr:ferredoxin [Deltaproteobacteria bacterium]
MKAKVDLDMCIGSGHCELSCPTIFKVMNGKAHVLKDPIPLDQKDCVSEAVTRCPVGAIRLS